MVEEIVPLTKTDVSESMRRLETKIEWLRNEIEKNEIGPLRIQLNGLRNELLRLGRREKSGAVRRARDAIERLTNRNERENRQAEEMKLKRESLKSAIELHTKEELSTEREIKLTESLLLETQGKLEASKENKRRLELQADQLSEAFDEAEFRTERGLKEASRIESQNSVFRNRLRNTQESTNELNTSVHALANLLRLRVDRLQSVKRECNELSNEKEISESKLAELRLSVVGLERSRKTLIKLEKALVQARTKLVRLTDEIETPKNIHPLREFESDRPELVTSVTELQRLKSLLKDKLSALSDCRKKISEAQYEVEVKKKISIRNERVTEVDSHIPRLREELKQVHNGNTAVLLELKGLRAVKGELKKRLASSRCGR